MIFSILFAAAAHIAVIDFYGLRHVSRAALQRALTIREGDPLPESKEALERRLASIPGVRAAHLGVVCCTDGGVVVWVGIEEKGSPRVPFRAPPTGNATLPADIDRAVDDFYVALENGVRNGKTGDDASRGYSLVEEPTARAIQLRFIDFAKRDLAILREVLRTSSSERERTHAAQVIAYAPNPQTVVPDLVAAMDDPSEDVRNAAIRALLIMATYARLHPQAKIAIPSRPFVKLLQSTSWTDREKAIGALDQLTVSRDPQILSMLRKEALPELTEAARWKLIGYAAPALSILGRIAAMPEDEIQKAIAAGDRNRVIDRIVR